jgi:hypothetical protein
LSKAFFSDEDIRQATIEAAQEQDIIINLPKGTEGLINHEVDSAAAIVQHLMGVLDRWEEISEDDIRAGDKIMVVFDHGEGNLSSRVGYVVRHDPCVGWRGRDDSVLLFDYEAIRAGTTILRARPSGPDPKTHEYVIDQGDQEMLYQRGREEFGEDPDLYYSPQNHLGVHPTEITYWKEVRLEGVGRD